MEYSKKKLSLQAKVVLQATITITLILREVILNNIYFWM